MGYPLSHSGLNEESLGIIVGIYIQTDIEEDVADVWWGATIGTIPSYTKYLISATDIMEKE
jgi:hypothetical protein